MVLYLCVIFFSPHFFLNFIFFFGMFSNKIYIEDLYYFDPLTEDKHRYTQTSGNGTYTYDSNGLTVKGNTMRDTYYYHNDLILPSIEDYKITVDIINYSSGDGSYSDFGFENTFIGTGSDKKVQSQVNNNWTDNHVSSLPFIDMKIEVSGNNADIYVNNEYMYSLSITRTQQQFFKTYYGRSTTFKNLKIHKL